MSFKCVHIADIHFRGLTRHDEYRESFEDFFEQIAKLSPDIIFVGGDIVHSKTQGISPELIDILTWWFKGMAKIAPTHIILGNHDGLISNKHRQDAITPIINAINDERLCLYKKSGIYPTGIDGFNWGVFSCFDEESWEDVKPTAEDINIALYHGGVIGSTTDINWDIDGEVETSFFDGFDFAFLGDIHRKQYLDEEKRIAYPGSTIQQNYGEDPGKGFLFWEIENKDVFTSTFYPVKHTKPFVTIDWCGTVSTTLESTKEIQDGSRFRVRSNFQIPQAEIKQLYAELKNQKDAAEIVFKLDEAQATQIEEDSESLVDFNFRDPTNILGLLKQYHQNQKITDEEWLQIEELLKKYCSDISKNDSPRNIKWSIKKIEFENTFSYGKENLINFDSLNGIIGLFGRNRSGKSSIPGSLMYGLFNSTDRGAIKNLHIINSRKGHCRTAIDFTVNGVGYRAERQSVKHQNRKGVVNAATHLNLFQTDSEGNSIKDMSGEQRRDTDKALRDLIGTREDFLLTSFASQGEMNAFIKHRATKRKEILANFLDLDIFEKMLALAKEDSAEIKVLLDRAPSREWNSIILEKGLKLRALQEERDSVENNLASIRNRLQVLRVEAVTQGDDIVTPEDVKSKKEFISTYESRLNEIDGKREKIESELLLANTKLEKISNIREQFPIEELRKKLTAQNELEKSLLKIKHELETEKQKLKTQNKSVKLLEQVPCGDQFPTCKFIHQSHRNKGLIEEQKEKIESLKKDVTAAQNSLKVLMGEDLSEKIGKYQKILDQEAEYRVSSSSFHVKSNDLNREWTNLDETLTQMQDELTIMQSRVIDESICGELNALKKQIFEMELSAKELDARRMSLSESIGLLTSSLQQLEQEKNEYTELLSDWRIYELIMGAVNKKGIPLQILTTQLPKINSEIAKILQGVVGFTVELEADKNSNAMDIYINYGDSRRIIECASGMEKMISSLAIRVALINVSSLPKSDILILDEGFGALDEMNIEACNRLLSSLKAWFKNILVISHIDAVKDAVDNVIDITRKGKDSRVYHE